MFKSISTTLAFAALLAVPTASQAVIYTFNASISGANEVLPATPGPGTGTAILDYNDNGTLTLTDDTYNFSMSVFGLTGGTAPGTAASVFHIHGAANTTQNGPVRVGLDSAPFVALNFGSTLLVGGNNVPAPTALFSNGTYVNLSFLSMLRSNLTYVNVHTALNPTGAVRGQLIEVTAVPEPSTYALWLAGLGVLGLVWRRQRPTQA